MLRTITAIFLSVFMMAMPGKYEKMPETFEIPTEDIEDIIEEDIIEYDFDEYESTESEYVVCAVDALNASSGFLVPPVKIEYDENKNCAEILCETLENYGYGASYSGNMDKDFYLYSVSGIDTARSAVPDALREFLIKNKVKISDTICEEGSLSEFDLTSSSGWIYTVNGEMPSVSMCDYYPEANDVIRLRYSLCFGADTGNYPDWGYEYEGLVIDNLDEAIIAIAEYGADNCAEALDRMNDVTATPDDIYSCLPVN